MEIDMSNKCALSRAACSHYVAITLSVLLAFFQVTAFAADQPADTNAFRALLEAAGWKAFTGPDGTAYLYPPEHAYAYLDQPADGTWSDIPPPGSRSLSTIVRQLELQGFNPIIEIDFEDGLWEVEAYRYGELVEFTFDAVLGQIRELSTEDD